MNFPTTTPQIVDTIIQIMSLEKDTTINVYLSRFLNPEVLNSVPNVSMKKDTPPADSLIALLSGKGYDKNGNQMPDSMLVYQIVSQSDTGLVYLVSVGNKIKLAKLEQDGNGFSDVTARVLAPNGKYADQNFRATVTPMRDVRGTLTDYENKPQVGYVMAVNGTDTSIVMTDSTGKFALQTNPTTGDTLKGHIIRPGRNEAFIRKFIFLAEMM